MVRARKPELKGLPHFNTKRGQTSSARTNQPLPPVPEAEESGNDRQTTEPKKGGIDDGLGPGACQTEAKGGDNTTRQTEPKDDDHDMAGQTNKTRSPRSPAARVRLTLRR